MADYETALIETMIMEQPYDVLECIGVHEKNYDNLKHIVHRAYLYRALIPELCREYEQATNIQTLVDLQEYAFRVYLEQTRYTDLTYSEAINYVPVLLNDDVTLKILFSLSPNDFMDEVAVRCPLEHTKFPVKLKSAAELGVYFWENTPEDFLEAGLAEQNHSGYLRDVVMQGYLRNSLNPETCMDYEKVRRPKNLKKLQMYGKKLWQEEAAVQLHNNKDISYKKVMDDITFLLHHQVNMVKLLILSRDEFYDHLEAAWESEKNPPVVEEEEVTTAVESQVKRGPRRLTPLAQLREELKAKEEGGTE